MGGVGFFTGGITARCVQVDEGVEGDGCGFEVLLSHETSDSLGGVDVSALHRGMEECVEGEGIGSDI